MQLNLSNNSLCVGKGIFGRDVYTTKGIKAIAKALKVNASLTKMLVGGNELGDEGTTILCDALRKSTVTKVQELDLRANAIGPEGAKAVAAMAAVVASLTSVR